MHHKNHKNSTSNHNNPAHMKNQYPTTPAPQSGPKRSVLSRLKERFQEKPATESEVKQLGLNAKREVYKTAIQKAKSARPSRFSGFGGGSSGPSYRKSSRLAPQENSFLFGPSNSGGGFLSSESTPSLSFITGVEEKKGRGRKQESGLGKGLTDLF